MNTLESTIQLPSRVEQWWNAGGEKEGTSPVMERMQKAYESFKAHGFPHTKMEDWKYTDVRKVTEYPYAWPVKGENHLSREFFKSFLLADLQNVYRLVFVNGYMQEDLSILPTGKNQFTVTHLGDAGGNGHYEKYLAQVASIDTPFAALNTALHTDGVLIHIQKNAEVDKPVLVYYVSLTDNDLYLIQPRNIVVTEPNSKVQFAEIFVSKGSEPSLTNVVTEITAGEGSYVDYSRIQMEENRNFHISYTGMAQQKDSRIDTHVLCLNGDFIRNDLHFTLQGSNCSSIMNGLYILSDGQFVDNHTRVDHAVPNCVSDQLYKGILNGKSTGVFNGKIIVHPDAQKTNAYQRNVNILLSDNATINTKPQLEIFADDVRCTHGATAGFIDEDAIFYMQARGISKEEARRLLMNAYANEIVEKMNVEVLKNPLREYISQKLK